MVLAGHPVAGRPASGVAPESGRSLRRGVGQGRVELQHLVPSLRFGCGDLDHHPGRHHRPSRRRFYLVCTGDRGVGESGQRRELPVSLHYPVRILNAIERVTLSRT